MSPRRLTPDPEGAKASLSKHVSPSVEPAVAAQLELAFDDNRLAAQLYGDFDQNLALDRAAARDQRDAARQSRHASRVATPASTRARRVLESLYALLEEGRTIDISNVDAVIRMVETEDSQLTLPTLEKKGKVRMAQIATRKATIVARTPAQDAYMRAMERSELIFGIGPAGTGKTYLAVAHAATLLERGDINRIILTRPAVEAGERLGFLPGDMKEKVDPYLRPLYDALYDMMRPEHVERCITSDIIEVAPLAFMRGRTLANAVVILDEAQNTTSMQMKMFLTRLGENSQDDRHRRPDPDRPAARRALRPRRGRRLCSMASRASTSRASPTATWCAMRSSARIVRAYEAEGAKKAAEDAALSAPARDPARSRGHPQRRRLARGPRRGRRDRDPRSAASVEAPRSPARPRSRSSSPTTPSSRPSTATGGRSTRPPTS